MGLGLYLREVFLQVREDNQNRDKTNTATVKKVECLL